MRTVVYGESITFTRNPPAWMETLYDDDEAEFDSDAFYGPPLVSLEILKNGGRTIYGPWHAWEDDGIEIISDSVFSYTWETPYTATPGIYTARWIIELGDEIDYDIEQFEIIEVSYDISEILDPPRTYGIIRETVRYQNMGFGTTDQLFLVGHGDGLPINDPYQVTSMKEAINLLSADPECPLLRGLLEAYNAGARDIWLVAAAPTAEFIPYGADGSERLEEQAKWGGLTYYERYKERLDTTLYYLKQFDEVQIITILEAPFYDCGDIDFIDQMLNHCDEAFALTGVPRIGIIGSRIGSAVDEAIAALSAEERFGIYAGATASNSVYYGMGKYVLLTMGEGTISLPQMPYIYSGQINAYAAGMLAASPMNSGLTYKTFSHIANLIGRDLTSQEVIDLARLRINPAIRRQKGKRGTPFQTCLATDNTLAADDSDYWAVTQIRVVAKCLKRIMTLGTRTLGTIGLATFEADVRRYLDDLVRNNMLRGYKLYVKKDQQDIHKALVDVVLMPYTGIRELFFQVEVGPGTGRGT